MKHPRSKKLKRISQAVFRGRKSQYSFDVFPITNEIEDAPAVFIFSRRQIDRFGNGHHFVSCIGETDSLLGEVKRHKRNKCVKQNESNVVCVMREENGTRRAAAIEDLKLNRSFACPHDADKTKLRPAKPDVKIFSPVKPVTDRPLSGRRTPRTRIEEAPVVVVSANGDGRTSRKDKAPSAARKSAKSGEPTRKVSPAAKKRVAKKVKRNTSSAVAVKPVADKHRGNGATKGAKRKAGRVATSPKTRTRVQGGVDSDGRQHRLPEPEKPVARAAKARTSRKSRSRSKLAA